MDRTGKQNKKVNVLKNLAVILCIHFELQTRTVTNVNRWSDAIQRHDRQNKGWVKN